MRCLPLLLALLLELLGHRCMRCLVLLQSLHVSRLLRRQSLFVRSRGLLSRRRYRRSDLLFHDQSMALVLFLHLRAHVLLMLFVRLLQRCAQRFAKPVLCLFEVHKICCFSVRCRNESNSTVKIKGSKKKCK